MGQLFFALQPDADASEQIADLAARISYEYDLAPPVLPNRLHLTLAEVGLFNADLVDRAVEIGASIWASTMTVMLDGIACFNGEPTPLVLTMREPRALQNLHAKLHQAMETLPPISNKSFAPHVTILYDNDAPDHYQLETPISWIAEEFALIHSDSGHEVVSSWPLRK